ncbi:hypothetical protein OA57_07400 [Chelonobacter oris]|uniref:VENN motif-containing domain-containing protein n=1 Tax=Chelonobacter oris TaxID=505317 RepID=A0A0A3ALB8_9PAST|nr:VENN motif pre-toxin domain-containing protein [Chelonobacter oris]KGQ70153.1 hypothetical protein OA57_07400 [Chelonobacter oris]
MIINNINNIKFLSGINHGKHRNASANVIAHTLLGAIEASATGNNALVGAAGSATAELTAPILTERLYGKSVKGLTESQKETVLTLSQIVSGLSGTLIGDGTQSAVVSAEIGKRAVENNWIKHMMKNPQIANDMLFSELAKEKQDEVEKEISKQSLKELADRGIPHYLASSIALGEASAKIAINTRNADLFGGYEISPNMTSKPSRIISMETGWIVNLKKEDLGDNLSRVISNTLEGQSVGVKGCYYGVCFGFSETISPEPKKLFSIGTGIGYSAGSDKMDKIK